MPSRLRWTFRRSPPMAFRTPASARLSRPLDSARPFARTGRSLTPLPSPLAKRPCAGFSLNDSCLPPILRAIRTHLGICPAPAEAKCRCIRTHARRRGDGRDLSIAPPPFSPPASIVGGSPSSRTRASDNPSQPASGTRPGQPPSAMRASGRLQLAPGSSSRPGPPPESLRARRDKLAASPACLCEAGPLTGSSTRPVDLLTSDFARSNVWLLWPYLRRREGGTPLLGR